MGIVQINEDTVKKTGDLYRIKRELAATEFVRKHTTIPVPKILEVNLGQERGWFLAERVPGTSLELAWLNMTDDARKLTTVQLQGYFQQLQNLHPAKPGFVGSCDDGPAYDHRIDNRSECGPFTSVSDFNDYLVAPVLRCPVPERAANYRKGLSDSYQTCFTHADLSDDHIFVDPSTGEVLGIIDWEMAGFWPEWWEYRKALYTSRQHIRWWIDLVRATLKNYDDELVLDCDLENY